MSEVREQLEKLKCHLPDVPTQLASLAEQMEVFLGPSLSPLREALEVREEEERLEEEGAPPLPTSPLPEADGPTCDQASRFGEFGDSAREDLSQASAALSALAVVQDMLKEKEEQLHQRDEELQAKVSIDLSLFTHTHTHCKRGDFC